MKDYWVYILLCKNNSYYTGYTDALGKRYQSHVQGTGKCKYTRSFKPIKIAQCWKIPGNKSLAMRVERYIKTLTRQEKEKLILHPAILIKTDGVKTVAKKMRIKMESGASIP